MLSRRREVRSVGPAGTHPPKHCMGRVLCRLLFVEALWNATSLLFLHWCDECTRYMFYVSHIAGDLLPNVAQARQYAQCAEGCSRYASVSCCLPSSMD